jgi:hypothetical protein
MLTNQIGKRIAIIINAPKVVVRRNRIRTVATNSNTPAKTSKKGDTPVVSQYNFPG